MFYTKVISESLTFGRNQQFTSTNLTFNNCYKGIRLNFDWIWSFKDLTFNNCFIGIDMWQLPGINPSTGGYTSASGNAFLQDSYFNNVEYGIVSSFNCSFNPPAAGSFIIDNTDFTGAAYGMVYLNGTVILAGGQKVVGWIQGPAFSASYSQEVLTQYANETCWVAQSSGHCMQGPYTPPARPAVLYDSSTSRIFDRAKPVYDDFSVSQFISAKGQAGCAGDGVTDDTACLQRLFNMVNFNQIAYIDQGAYVITSQLLIPANIRIVGEGWPKLMIKESPLWSDMSNPTPAIIIGNKGDVGKLEMQDVVIEVMGNVPGAILVEINIEGDAPGSAGMLS
jgi:glucan 1,3-beta-glucosidase